jgi:hypothetical protein
MVKMVPSQPNELYLENASLEVLCTQSTGLRLIKGVHGEVMVLVRAAWRINIVPGTDKQTTVRNNFVGFSQH